MQDVNGGGFSLGCSGGFNSKADDIFGNLDAMAARSLGNGGNFANNSVSTFNNSSAPMFNGDNMFGRNVNNNPTSHGNAPANNGPIVRGGNWTAETVALISDEKNVEVEGLESGIRGDYALDLDDDDGQFGYCNTKSPKNKVKSKKWEEEGNRHEDQDLDDDMGVRDEPSMSQNIESKQRKHSAHENDSSSDDDVLEDEDLLNDKDQDLGAADDKFFSKEFLDSIGSESWKIENAKSSNNRGKNTRRAANSSTGSSSASSSSVANGSNNNSRGKNLANRINNMNLSVSANGNNTNPSTTSTTNTARRGSLKRNRSEAEMKTNDSSTTANSTVQGLKPDETTVVQTSQGALKSQWFRENAPASAGSSSNPNKLNSRNSNPNQNNPHHQVQSQPPATLLGEKSDPFKPQWSFGTTNNPSSNIRNALKPTPSYPTAAKPGAKICTNWRTYGHCGIGAKCKFAHNGVSEERLEELRKKYKFTDIGGVKQASGADNKATALAFLDKLRKQKVNGADGDGDVDMVAKSVTDVVGDKKLVFASSKVKDSSNKDSASAASTKAKAKKKIVLSIDESDDDL